MEWKSRHIWNKNRIYEIPKIVTYRTLYTHKYNNKNETDSNLKWMEMGSNMKQHADKNCKFMRL